MAFYDSYKYEEYGKVFEIADGDYSVVIVSAAEKQAKSGKGMIEISLKVADNPVIYIERYVDGEYFNSNMSSFFDAFGIKPGNFNFPSWAGKCGQAHFIHKQEQYQDKSGEWKTVNRTRMQYLIV